MTASTPDDPEQRPESAAATCEPAPRQLTPAAQRALAEADERRRIRDAAAEQRPAELGGQKGPDPVRYGDWEKGGIVSDF